MTTIVTTRAQIGPVLRNRDIVTTASVEQEAEIMI
jgi:hypothetical protein